MKLLTAIGAFWLASTVAAMPQTITQGAGCNAATANIRIGDNSTYIQQVNCSEIDPEKSFAIRYLWVDANNISYLLAGYPEKNLGAITGSPAIILRNEIYDRVNRLFSRYGERIAPDGFPIFHSYNTKLLGTSNKEISSNFSFEDIPDKIRRRLKFCTRKNTMA
ncbi:hypothetical protein ACQVP2_35225 [Methylobacterium aquaticum]|uniref:hypothetical protein n=1 Tax=Methylobacterium aquaticum TaxID=270351 RepID=UPI003D182F86